MGSRLSLATVVGLFAATTPAFAQQPTPAPTSPQPQPAAPPPLEPPPSDEPQPAETQSVTAPIAEPMATPAPPPAPETIVVNGGVSKANLGMLLGAGAGLGLGVGFFIAAHSDSSDADDARTVADHDRISSRATALYIGSAVALGAGVALGVLALHRINVEKEHNTTVSFAPRANGGSFVLEGSW